MKKIGMAIFITQEDLENEIRLQFGAELDPIVYEAFDQFYFVDGCYFAVDLKESYSPNVGAELIRTYLADVFGGEANWVFIV